MSKAKEKIKVGDYVFTQSEICAFLVNKVHEDTVDVCQPTGIITIDKEDCKKVYVSDTPPPEITQTEVEIKSGHMAGYGEDKPKVVQFSPPEDGKHGTVLYNNGLMFELAQEDVWSVLKLPHEQEGLKHLFEDYEKS